MQASRTWAGVGLLGLVAVCAGWLLWPDAPPESGTVTALVGNTGNIGSFAPSMQGTVPDGDLRTVPKNQPANVAGALPYAELKRLFDYYLSAVGEQDIPAITQQITRALEQSVSPNQLRAAQLLLARYLEFKRALVELEQNPALAGSGVQAIRQRFVAMQDLRARIFSAAEDQGMFGFEDAYDMDALARLEISQNPKLSASQKRDQLAVVDASMSAALRADREVPRVVIKVEEMARQMRANGASDDEVYRMRAKELDPQAASRLAEVDQDELAWKNRIAAYLSERSKVLKAQADMPDSERQAALTQLQQSQFTEEERRRLPAYEN
jgi:lipase chaperone LimK